MIQYDFRERESGVPDMLRGFGIEVVETTLEVGDYLVGNVCVERKTIQDYLSSKESGHLDRQLTDMSNSFELSYVIISGVVSSALMNCGIPRGSYLSSLCGSSLKRSATGMQGQIVTVNVEADEDCAYFLRFLHKKVSEKDFVRLPRIKKRPFNPDRILEYILCGFPKIGEKRAKIILKHSRTLKGFTNLEAWQLASILGQKLGGEVYGLLNLEYGGE